MAKFKPVEQTFLLKKTIGFWSNMVKNFRSHVQDDDFFDLVRNGFDHDKAVELIEAAYSEGELKEMSDRRARRQRLDLSDSLDEVFQSIWNNEPARDKCRVVLQAIGKYILEEHASEKSETLEKRFLEIRRVFKLSDLEYDVLLLSYVCNQTCFAWPVRMTDRDKPLYFAMALDRSYPEVLSVMNAQGRLLKYGILDGDWDFSRSLHGFLDGVTSETIQRRFYKRTDDKDVLPWSFYGELAKGDGEVIKSILASNPKRCNILFYGAPGTGKTSFARTIAKEVGRTAFEIKQGDDDGKNMKAEARMMGVQICNDQESPDESLMIVDEADELLRGNVSVFDMLFGGGCGGKSTEKGVMNSILDEMQMPAIWISNAPARAMDESVRRRFDYSICFEELNTQQRISIWQNIVEKQKLKSLISGRQIEEYAAKYATSAGGISTVLENVKRMSPKSDKVDELVATLMRPHCKLMDVKDANRFLPAKGYSLEGLNIKGKTKLENVVKAVRNYYDTRFNESGEDAPRMNLLMFGPPGTGKTEFVKYLAKALDRRVLVMKGSDILSKYVGESEQHIARAFRRAEVEHAILFFDEIDGLVQSRENAHASWEISQVNELLQQMENFRGVMIAATNFCKNLDPAIMRRFTFKLEFDYLDDAGKKSFFERMFKTELSDGEFADLKLIRNLAPGDFRTVRQEQFYLDDNPTNADRIAALREECLLKRDGEKTARIGFAA